MEQNSELIHEQENLFTGQKTGCMAFGEVI